MSAQFAHDDRFLIIDDCTLYREGLAALLVAAGAEVHTAWDPLSLRSEIDRGPLDVILLNMGSRDSAALLRVCSGNVGARVIAIGLSDTDESEIVSCAESGVAGYHLRSESYDDLLILIQRVRDGETACSAHVGAILLRRLSEVASWQVTQAQDTALTSREEEILRLLEMGMSNREIAAFLCIAVHTVKNHVHSILSKLGVRSRSEAAARSRAIDQSPGGHRTMRRAPTLLNEKSSPPKDGAA